MLMDEKYPRMQQIPPSLGSGVVQDLLLKWGQVRLVMNIVTAMPDFKRKQDTLVLWIYWLNLLIEPTYTEVEG